MKFPPWDPAEPSDAQLIPFMHADTRQLYETGEMRRSQWEQLRSAVVAEYKAAQRSRSNNTVSTSYDTYTIRKQIGQGGNGFVYAVTDSSGCEFALKLLDPRTSTEEKRKRFKNELGFCERNKHKNILTVVDRGLFEDAPFYVMPFYWGSLKDLMKNPIEHQKILPIFSQILDGIEAAHLQNVIHRDLKPENILFDRDSATPVIADFGIAHFEEEDLITAVETKDGRRLANFDYAAPEQCKRGLKVDHRADIYALGLILNEMFTGALARGTNYKTIASVAADYSYVDTVVSQMLCSNASDRPQNIEAIKRQLRARQHEFFVQQRLSELQQTVVPASNLDDELFLNPPKLIDWDWVPDQLTLILSEAVTDRWVLALQTMGGYSSILGKGPDRFTFRNNRAIIPAREFEVQPLIDHFRTWLPAANQRYENLLRQEKAEQTKKEHQKLKAEIEANEARARLRKTIKL